MCHNRQYYASSLIDEDPLTYDRLIRRFQTPGEREAEGRKKGYSGVLEADLWRSEAKIYSLASPDHAALMRYRCDTSGEIVSEEKDEAPADKEEGMQRWQKEMEMMFVRGADPDFDYAAVDGSEEYDDRGIEEREEQERWFEEEEPASARGVEHDDEDRSITLTGQTSIQDY